MNSSSSKLVLVAIAIVAVGLFALPSSVSLFSGQHTWYDLKTSDDSGVLCQKCHADIEAEMVSAGNGVHTTLHAPGCDCHRVNGTGVAVSGPSTGTVPGTTSHAAETIACMLCHENATRTGGNYPFAGGFSITKITEAGGGSTIYNYTDSGTKAAHNYFIGQAIADTLMEDSNEACIACHTRVGVNITWTKNKVMAFDATEGSTGDWSLTGFKAEGQDVYPINWTNEWTG
ncbi:MAG: hypothetical protein WBB08_02340 [Halobacteriota archaeon]